MNPPNPLAFLQQQPYLIPALIALPVVVAAIIFLVMKFNEMREERASFRGWQQEDEDRRDETPASQQTGQQPYELPKPKSEKEITIDELRAREERLRVREESLKRRKLAELGEKEQLVERKHVTNIVKEERQVTDEQEELLRREQRIDEMRNDRKRLVKLIELAEDRYNDGLMSEKNFRSIMASYQKELVEMDVEMAKLRD
ncbi:MAG: hypothetical protein PHG85_05420 [Candidatus Altiarchaeota archaeon]|nr:hypothetical protein [Candidatus Altiarchaeota archaeon]